MGEEIHYNRFLMVSVSYPFPTEKEKVVFQVSMTRELMEIYLNNYKTKCLMYLTLLEIIKYYSFKADQNVHMPETGDVSS